MDNSCFILFLKIFIVLFLLLIIGVISYYIAFILTVSSPPKFYLMYNNLYLSCDTKTLILTDKKPDNYFTLTDKGELMININGINYMFYLKMLGRQDVLNDITTNENNNGPLVLEQEYDFYYLSFPNYNDCVATVNENNNIKMARIENDKVFPCGSNLEIKNQEYKKMLLKLINV